ncbi:hypothetical protein SAY87_022314 [Trapa incisa]|uniref:Uncharacterized protein n=2 Tax=Trapa TaxID=22665 RepID=A0AAN7R0M8_TRANT|nr:hypothetical protein SAY87_022314 [Trapa incisa]KAK4783530.1 hypothetical protein SAY86_007904 [Trapa natans]
MAQETTLRNTIPLKRIKDAGLSGLGNFVKLLPTGTIFMFHFLNPLLSNNGDCEKEYEVPIKAFIGFCGISCFISTFTDSYVDLEGLVHCGIVTPAGLWPSGDGSVDLSKYKLRIMDFIHAFLSLGVFLVLTLLDSETVRCFYQKYAKDGNNVLKLVPAIAGVVSGIMFTTLKNNRHGIGYPFDWQQLSRKF